MISEFTLEDGNPISINLDRVATFQPADEGTLIMFEDTFQVTVTMNTTQRPRWGNVERQAGR